VRDRSFDNKWFFGAKVMIKMPGYTGYKRVRSRPERGTNIRDQTGLPGMGEPVEG
jgi:hypothetical protein